jgi:hypothetical protein
MKDIIAVAFIAGFIGGLVWLFIQPEHNYIGTYCSPQNTCRYETFNYPCPPDDSSNIIIGQTMKLKPNSCEEQK